MCTKLLIIFLETNAYFVDYLTLLIVLSLECVLNNSLIRIPNYTWKNNTHNGKHTEIHPSHIRICVLNFVIFIKFYCIEECAFKWLINFLFEIETIVNHIVLSMTIDNAMISISTWWFVLFCFLFILCSGYISMFQKKDIHSIESCDIWFLS